MPATDWMQSPKPDVSFPSVHPIAKQKAAVLLAEQHCEALSNLVWKTERVVRWQKVTSAEP